ncbi:hypothetical protein AB5I41_10705 [Sphingomonas sp. MMS24-JH45]
MGDPGGDHLARPSVREIEHMATLTREAMAAGALGFSTSRTHAIAVATPRRWNIAAEVARADGMTAVRQPTRA